MSEPVEKLYVIVRQDLSPGYQIPQAIHAKDEFTHKYPEVEQEWFTSSNTIVVLGVADEDELFQVVGRVQREKLKFALFFEPDIQEYTSVAVEPGQKTSEILQNLKPAGKGMKRLVA